MTGLLQQGDSIVVWELDRLGRSPGNFIDLIKRFEEKKVKVVSLQDNINTQTAQGNSSSTSLIDKS